jgi:hypothetical protein
MILFFQLLFLLEVIDGEEFHGVGRVMKWRREERREGKRARVSIS